MLKLYGTKHVETTLGWVATWPSVTVKQGSTVVQGRSILKYSWSDNFDILKEKFKVNFPLLGR